MEDKPPTYSFGEYIRLLRLERHLSLTGAAKRMGMSPQKLSDIESGRRYNKRISLTLVNKAAECYSVPINEIVKNIETSINNEKTISDCMRELAPLTRMVELLAVQMKIESAQFSAQLESLANEIHTHASSVAVLTNLMYTQHFGGK